MRLEGVLREIDALGRFAGDEFVVVAEGCELAAGPERIAERLLEALGEPFELARAAEGPLPVSPPASAWRWAIATTADELLRDADIAMYRAKWEGKNRFVVFESGMQDAVQPRMALEMDLREALDKGEFFLVYQPTFDLRRMTPTGVEALLRWRHPARGIMQPDGFVPLLEETGIIAEVGGWVMRRPAARRPGGTRPGTRSESRSTSPRASWTATS